VNVHWTSCSLTLLPSHKWIIQIMQLVAFYKPVDLPPTNHTVYMINMHNMSKSVNEIFYASRFKDHTHKNTESILWVLSMFCTFCKNMQFCNSKPLYISRQIKIQHIHKLINVQHSTKAGLPISAFWYHSLLLACSVQCEMYCGIRPKGESALRSALWTLYKQISVSFIMYSSC